MTTQILLHGSSQTDLRAGRTARLTALLGITLLMAGCGGGGSPSPPPQTISVTVSPSTATVEVGKTQQFTATVSGTTNTAVTWSVNNVAGGNSTVGTISSAGLYTAPGTVPNPNTVTVKATSQADATKSASSSVSILTPPVSVVISPTSATVQVNQTQQFTASVSGATNNAVVWSVSGVPGGNASVGTVSSSGLYTAPPTPGSAPTASGQPVSVSRGFDTSNVNISLASMTPSLQFIAIGTCPSTGNCTAGSTGIQLAQASSARLFLVGNGFVPGTIYSVSGPSDVTVLQPTSSDFIQTTDGIDAVKVNVTVSSTAIPSIVTVTATSQADPSVSASATVTIPGPRNVIVSNLNGELTVFAGGLLICPLTGCP